MKNLTPEIIAKAKTANSLDELIAIAKANGVELTADEAKKYFEQISANGEVSDDELDLVAGGCGVYFKNGEKVKLKNKCKCGCEYGIYIEMAPGTASAKCMECGEITVSGAIAGLVEKLS